MKMIQDPTGQTKIDWDSLSRSEQVLMEKVTELTEQYPNVETWPEEDLKLIREAYKVMMLKIFELFRTFKDAVLGDSLAQHLYWLRFFAFEQSTQNILVDLALEDKYYQGIEAKYGEHRPEDLPGPEGLHTEGERSFNEQLKKIHERIVCSDERRLSRRRRRQCRKP